MSSPSKKHPILSGISSPNSKKRKVEPNSSLISQEELDVNDNLLFSVLTKAGFSSNDEGEQYQIHDPLQLRRYISQTLRNASDANFVNEFKSEIENHFQDVSKLRKSLLPSCTPSGSSQSQGETMHSTVNHDSLVKILLGVEALQPFLIDILLEKLPEFSDDDAESFGSNIPLLILSQFRWLDHIVDSNRLCQKLLQALEVCPPSFQKEIIKAIPEVIDDGGHEIIVEALQKMMTEDSQFMVPVLDALSNLNLRPDLMDQVQTNVLLTLNSASVDDLPVVIKFVFHTITPKNVQRVIKEFRNNLVLETISQLSISHNKRKSDKGAEALILEALKSGIRWKKEITQAFLKEIQSIGNASEHKIIDIWILFILYSLNNYKKTVEGVFRKKINQFQFNEELLKNSLQYHAPALKDHFPVLLSLAESFLRSVENTVRSFGSSLYILTFSVFEESYYRQEVLGNVIMHAGSGSPSEVDAALDILIHLVESSPASVVPFTAFIKGILDYVYGLQDTQVRKAFRVFSALAYVQHSGMFNEGMTDELEILIQKQLSNSSIHYKRIGIIGATSMIRKLGTVRDGDKEISQEQIAYVVDTLEKMVVNCKKSYVCMAFLCDELYSLVSKRKIHPKAIAWLRETFDLTEFINDMPDKLLEDEVKYWFYSSEQQQRCYISIFELLNGDSAMKESLLCLPAHFKLMQYCESLMNKGDLEEINALLSCPIFMFDKGELSREKFAKSKQKEAICLALFHAINWFREVVNAFSVVDQDWFTTNVLTRVENIVEMENLLNSCLSMYPQFSLTMYIPANSNVGIIHPKFPVDPSEKKKKEKVKKEGKKSKKAEPKKDKSESKNDDKQNQEEGEEVDKENDESTSKKDDQDLGYVNALRPYFRELELHTSLVLSRTRANDDDSQQQLVVKMPLVVLRYFLEDLHNKLKIIIAPTRKRAIYLPTEKNKPTSNILDKYSPLESLRLLVPVFPALCVHLQRVAEEWLDDENDGDMEQWQHLLPCMLTIFECFEKLFSFEEFLDPANEKLFREILFQITTTGKSKEIPPLDQLRRDAYHYFENFTRVAKDLKTGVHVFNLLHSIFAKDNQVIYTTKLSNLAGEFVKKADWTEDRPKAEQVSHLLTQYIKLSPKPLAVIEQLSLEVMPNFLAQDDIRCDENYGTLTKHTFLAYYKVLLTELVTLFEQNVYTHFSSAESHDPSSVEANLYRLQKPVQIFQGLIELIKIKDQKMVLGISLKQGKLFIEHFMKTTPFLAKYLMAHPRAIQQLLRNLQSSTRILQALCAHAKALKDRSLTSVVPGVRKVLESLIFKVKSMLQANNCLEAFWLGNLKHRNIRGEEISSQTPETQEVKQKKSKSREQKEDKGSKKEEEEEGVEEEEKHEDESEAEAEEAEVPLVDNRNAEGQDENPEEPEEISVSDSEMALDLQDDDDEDMRDPDLNNEDDISQEY